MKEYGGNMKQPCKKCGCTIFKPYVQDFDCCTNCGTLVDTLTAYQMPVPIKKHHCPATQQESYDEIKAAVLSNLSQIIQYRKDGIGMMTIKKMLKLPGCHSTLLKHMNREMELVGAKLPTRKSKRRQYTNYMSAQYGASA
jgi:hypothetical protein